jgi:hypothetical protein
MQEPSPAESSAEKQITPEEPLQLIEDGWVWVLAPEVVVRDDGVVVLDRSRRAEQRRRAWNRRVRAARRSAGRQHVCQLERPGVRFRGSRPRERHAARSSKSGRGSPDSDLPPEHPAAYWRRLEILAAEIQAWFRRQAGVVG